MCRKNQLLGVAALAFGLGLLMCGWFESGFLRICFGVGLVVTGVVLLQKK